MTEKTINRRQPDPEGLDFEGLRREGIRLLQDLCGKSWTDYNLHDPGVTILEQLCYALTDLRYRAEFKTADYLTGKDGQIDFEKQALYLPHEIFPSQPTTITDYRKILYDAIPGIHNVWIETERKHQAGNKASPSSEQNGHMHGLYHAYVSLQEPMEQDNHGVEQERQDIEDVRKTIRNVYAENRNLCEDLAEISFVDRRYYRLHACIEIESKSDPAELLGEIYFRCLQYIAPGITCRPYEEIHRERKSLAEILTGPLTQHGYIDEGDLDRARESVTISELIAVVRAIEGVKDINDMWFVTQEGQHTKNIECDPSFQTIPWLRFPSGEKDIEEVTLHKTGRQYMISFSDLRAELDRRQAEYHALRTNEQDPKSFYECQKGEPRQLNSYHSIQNDFPAIYGINQYGLPDSEPPRRKAQAKQLKAYLLLFEQLMANFLENLKEIPRLFSIDDTLKQSYFHQALSKTQVPDVESLYKDHNNLKDDLLQIVKGYDNFFDRRDRVLDYLLAIYGEKFTQWSLRQFNYYYTEQKFREKLIRNKIKFLTHIVEISRTRAGAFNYLQAAWNTDNSSTLQKKVGILLGLKDLDAAEEKLHVTRSLTGVFTNKDLVIITNEDERSTPDGDEGLEQPLPPIPAGPPMGEKKYDKGAEDSLFEKISFLKNNQLSESILRNGIDRAKYEIKTEGRDIHLLPEKTNLATYGTKEEADHAVDDLIRLLIRLNVESEGLHIVEHILLRPEGNDKLVPDEFYPFRISVLFPSWTARFNNLEFQKLAEETVQLNCPAHVHPEFYWFDFTTMREFEALYKNWLAEKRGNAARAQAVNTAALKLTLFLKLCEFERLYRNWLEEKRGDRAREQDVDTAALKLVPFLEAHLGLDLDDNSVHNTLPEFKSLDTNWLAEKRGDRAREQDVDTAALKLVTFLGDHPGLDLDDDSFHNRLREFEGLYKDWLEEKHSDRARAQEVDTVLLRLITSLEDHPGLDLDDNSVHNTLPEFKSLDTNWLAEKRGDRAREQDVDTAALKLVTFLGDHPGLDLDDDSFHNRLREFEGLYKDWLEEKHSDRARAQEVDTVLLRLITSLEEHSGLDLDDDSFHNRLREFEGLYKDWLEEKHSDRARAQEVDTVLLRLITSLEDHPGLSLGKDWFHKQMMIHLGMRSTTSEGSKQSGNG